MVLPVVARIMEPRKPLLPRAPTRLVKTSTSSGDGRGGEVVAYQSPSHEPLDDLWRLLRAVELVVVKSECIGESSCFEDGVTLFSVSVLLFSFGYDV
uniref:Uncharacterized protein n=1 Tax=Solanum tuberosum TaxID=4113 RepID=M1DK68_SOLTU